MRKICNIPNLTAPSPHILLNPERHKGEMGYFIYVIKLDDEDMRRDHKGRIPKRIQKQNPHMDWDYPLRPETKFFYVGQSAHRPECRFAQHKECYGDNIRFLCICPKPIRKPITKNRSNRYVRLYGQYLSKQHYAHVPPIKGRINAENKEGWLADQLRQQGHVVYFN